MEQELNQIVQAILVASDPSQTSLHQQALEYLSTIQHNAQMTWRWALAIFVEAGTEGGSRKYPPQARFFALRLLDEFLDSGSGPLDSGSFEAIQESLLNYIRSEYVFGPAEADSSFLRNKFSHTLTLLFLRTYVEQWPTFFRDLFTLISPTESSSQSTFNPHVSLLFFHMILEISGEVADQMLKAARQHTSARHARDAGVRDAVRERDAARINEAVLTIVAANVDKMTKLRAEDGSPISRRELDTAEEVVDWGVRTFGSYVGWIDINLTVTATTVPLLFGLLSDASLPIRLATCVALSRIVSKGLKEPGDKLQLIKVLSLGDVLASLEHKTREQQVAQRADADDVDEGEESYREALGRLLNVLGLELCKLSEDSQVDVRGEAAQLLDQVLPVMLRFLADDYDDTSSTVFTLLQTILANHKKARKLTSDPLDDSTRSFLTSLLTVLLEKLRWEEDADPVDMDEDDKAAFEGLRKDLRTFVDSVLIIDPALVTDAVQTLALNTLNAYQSGISIKWNDAELAVYLVWIFGEINKSGGGKGRASFCHTPAIDKEKRKYTDYSEFPLTAHGEMLYTLIQSGISSYPHPAVSTQFFETTCRYIDFFKVRKECIMPTLHAMIDTRGLHNPSSNVRARVFYLFHRFIKEARNEISSELAGTLLESIRDLLPIEVDIPELDNPEQQDLLTESIKNPGLFDPQLYLFETAGVLISLFWRNAEQSANLLLSVVKPLMNELSVNLQTVKASQDVLSILKIHHAIMALGNVAKGFPDFPSPIPDGYILPPLDVFQEIAQAMLMSLESLNAVKGVRDATRSAFARILAPTGNSITYLIPPLMANLLIHSEPSELADFMNFIGLLIHRLRDDMFTVLNELISPLTSHVSQFMSQPATGTDDTVTHGDTKKAYLALLNSIMSAKLHGVFLSERNKGQFEGLLGTMEQLIEDISDPGSEKSALQFLGRCVNAWGNPEGTATVVSGIPQDAFSLPGFERFIYERLIPATFRVLSMPDFSIKDGQLLTVSYEIATFYQNVAKVRGQETLDFFVSVFLPSQNWPPEMAMDFATKLRDLDNKAFKKYFTDIVRASRDGS